MQLISDPPDFRDTRKAAQFWQITRYYGFYWTPIITWTLQGHSPKTMMYIVVFTIPTITIIATDIAMYFKVKSLNLLCGPQVVDCGSTVTLSRWRRCRRMAKESASGMRTREGPKKYWEICHSWIYNFFLPAVLVHVGCDLLCLCLHLHAGLLRQDGEWGFDS